MNQTAAINCCVEATTRIGHAEQVYTGLALLHAEGTIRLRQRTRRTDRYDTSISESPVGRQDAVHPGFVQIVVENKKRIHIDLGDGHGIDTTALSECDYYFKRSYSSETIEELGEEGKRIRPFGLNYEVFRNWPDRFLLQRVWNLTRWREIPREILRAVDVFGSFSSLPRLNKLSGKPDPKRPPRAIFLARTWDPHDDPNRTKEKSEEFHQINEIRASCIRILRREFGRRFHGGFSHTEYSRKNYSDLLAPIPEHTAKRSYLELLRDFPVCVATTGLHGSIGWKFAEYIALSKSVVSEPLKYEAPGCFRPGQNYQIFTDPVGCAEAVARLFDDPELRAEMMIRNHAYYENYLRPDRLMLRVVKKAL